MEALGSQWLSSFLSSVEGGTVLLFQAELKVKLQPPQTQRSYLRIRPALGGHG